MEVPVSFFHSPVLPAVAVREQVKFTASHLLPDHRGKCQGLHDHNFVLEVIIRGSVNEVATGKPNSGTVFDHAELGMMTKRLRDECLHGKHLNDFDPFPTPERLVLRIAYLLLLCLGGRTRLEQVLLFDEIGTVPGVSVQVGLPGKALVLASFPDEAFPDTALSQARAWCTTGRIAALEQRHATLNDLDGPERLVAQRLAPDCPRCPIGTGKSVEFKDDGAVPPAPEAIVTCDGCKRVLRRCARSSLSRAGSAPADSLIGPDAWRKAQLPVVPNVSFPSGQVSLDSLLHPGEQDFVNAMTVPIPDKLVIPESLADEPRHQVLGRDLLFLPQRSPLQMLAEIESGIPGPARDRFYSGSPVFPEDLRAEIGLKDGSPLRSPMQMVAEESALRHARAEALAPSDPRRLTYSLKQLRCDVESGVSTARVLTTQMLEALDVADFSAWQSKTKDERLALINAVLSRQPQARCPGSGTSIINGERWSCGACYANGAVPEDRRIPEHAPVGANEEEAR